VAEVHGKQENANQVQIRKTKRTFRPEEDGRCIPQSAKEIQEVMMNGTNT
jgi:hypothetical protein